MQISNQSAWASMRFRCKVGGEWKNFHEFSSTQQNNLQRGATNGRQIDPAHCGMTCMQHSAGSRTEMRCELCNNVKPVDEFSKSSRRNGVYECRRCVAWTEIQEPGMTPGPLETGHISPEEMAQQPLRQRFFTSEDFFEEENEDDLVPRAPITALSSLGLDDSYAEVVGASCVEEILSRTRHSDAASSAASNASVASGPSVASLSARSLLPPHLREKHKAVNEAATSSAASSTNGDISMPTTLREMDSDTASRASRRFNAWGPDGQAQRRVASSTAGSSLTPSSDPSDAHSSALSSAASVKENDDPNIIGDWTIVKARPQVAAQNRGHKTAWSKGPEDKLSILELRAARGETHQGYIRRENDEHKATRPIGYDEDDFE